MSGARYLIANAMRPLVRAGPVERHALDSTERRGSRRYADRLTDGGRSALAR